MKKVLIIFGGNSSEHYISCKSAKSIVSNIDKKLFSYELVGIDFNGDWYKFNDSLDYLSDGNWLDGRVFLIDNIIEYLRRFDVVFPITHGNYGEDGKLQGFLDLFNIRYVGCKTTSSVIGFDKSLSKLFFDSLGIPQVPYVVLCKKYNVFNIIDEIGFPMIVKPCCGGSSIGVTIVRNDEEFTKALDDAFKWENELVIEEFVEGREFSVGVLSGKALPIIEIAPVEGF